MQRGLAGTSGAYLIGALLLVAAVEQQPVLALIAFLLLVLMILTIVWRRKCLTNVEYHRFFTPDRAFVGETIDFRTEIVNRKILPLPWLELDEEIPESMHIVAGGKAGISSIPLRAAVHNLLSMQWYERVVRNYKVLCTERGYHTFGPAVLHSGDIFGFFSDHAEVPKLDYVLVYPEVVPLQELGLPTKQPFGSRKAQLRILDDPMRIAGIREYTTGDSLKRVHWKATARTQQLQVKLLEPSADLDLLLFLNVTTFVPDWQGNIPVLLEEAIVVAASLADHAFKQGYKVGLYVNTNVPGSDQESKLASARDPDQMMRILETLAKVAGFATVSMDIFMQQQSVNLPWGATVVLVTAVAPDPMLAALYRLKRAGHKVATVLVGDHEISPSTMAGLNVFIAKRNPGKQTQDRGDLALV